MLYVNPFFVQPDNSAEFKTTLVTGTYSVIKLNILSQQRAVPTKSLIPVNNWEEENAEVTKMNRVFKALLIKSASDLTRSKHLDARFQRLLDRTFIEIAMFLTPSPSKGALDLAACMQKMSLRRNCTI